MNTYFHAILKIARSIRGNRLYLFPGQTRKARIHEIVRLAQWSAERYPSFCYNCHTNTAWKRGLCEQCSNASCTS